MPKLLVIIASTREGRLADPIGRWAVDAATRYGKFDVEVADLAEVDLPMLWEPNHPRMARYVGDQTKAWSAKVDAADAFLFVTPEYNYGPPPVLVNAIDHLYWEWAYKPVGFVSYGGVAAGLRGVQVTKQIVTTLKMVPVNDGVAIPFVMAQMKGTEFVPSPVNEAALPFHLDEVLRWAEALEPLQNQVPELRKLLPPGAPAPAALGKPA